MEDLTPQQIIRAKLHVSQIKCGSMCAGTPESATQSILLLSSALELASKNHLSYYEALVTMHMVNCQVRNLITN